MTQSNKNDELMQMDENKNFLENDIPEKQKEVGTWAEWDKEPYLTYLYSINTHMID